MKKQMSQRLIKQVNEHFSFKLFIVFGAAASLISIFFTGYYLFYQSRALNESTIKNGIFQVKMLAHNSRIGVFSENKELLNDPVTAIFQQEEVLLTIVFNTEGKLLKKLERTKQGVNSRLDGFIDQVKTDRIKTVRRIVQPVYFESKDGIEFWSPVLSGSNDVLYELPYPDDVSPHNDGEIIGYVMIKIGKDTLVRQFKDLLVMSIVILGLFLVIAFFASYFIAERISDPLNRLIRGVRTIEKGMVAEKLPVETKDEIGLLAEAFNDMSESLRKRENDLKKVNREIKNQHEQRKMLSKRLIDLLEKDREHIAMELHDHVGQTLISLKLNLEMILEQKKDDPLLFESRIKTSRERAVQALRDIKQISRGLKPSVLDSLGLVSSLKELISEIEANTGIVIKFFTNEIPKNIGREKELAIYRISQEALNNIMKHTKADTVFISLVVRDDKISFSIEDNGDGFVYEKAAKFTKGGYFGLAIMRERAEQLQGEFNIETETGKGTHILVEFPV